LSGTNNIYVYYTSPITQVIAPSQGTVQTAQLGNITNIASGNSSLTLQTGSSNTTALTVDTSQNVGIGTSTPGVKLDLNGGDFRIQQSASTARQRFIAGSNQWNVETSNSTNQYAIYDAVAGLARIVINSSGYITTPYQPSFMVGFTTGGNLSLADGVLITFNDKTSGSCFDVSGSFNTSTSRFTAPVTGVYLFMVTIASATIGGYSVQMKKNGTSIGNSVDTFAGFMYNAAGNTQDMITSLQVQLNSSDYVEVFTRNGAYSVYKNHSWFLGRLVG
jgi:hypothetical protein